jgi:demethylmenaquinone methyltransferase/2-methoxy-6-polyprenyl-1,4-benzoquinol methylase
LNPNEHGRRVSGLFDNIARWYDFLNHFLSAGQDVYWRRRLVRYLRPGRTRTVLDLAAGTLDVSREIRRQHPELRVLSLDFSRPMLCRGKAKIAGEPSILPVQADGRALPLREILRVLAPGGRLCILEFGTGKARIWRGLYNFYLGTVLPRIGRFFSKNPEAYQYLADTILAFPDSRALAAELAEAGFNEVGCQPLCSGIVYIHVARKPQ